MRSNYKQIGKYVQQVNVRNKDLSVVDLKGISINKEFMPSVANVNGTDLSTYKVVEREQFAFNPMHVGRDEVLPICMLESQDRVIVSPAYVVFEVKDKNELLPEYLMMWCRRPEFDRNAWFTTDSSVRGGFSWEDYCEMELPVPSIEKQREIVREYNTIVNRIKLNEQLNQKLEETAQAIYKQWFVDFEFPNEAGKPYKSSGGEMVYNEELEQEIPKGWEVTTLDELLNFKNGSSKPQSIGAIPIYGGNGILGYTDRHNNENIIAIGRVGAYCGSLYRVLGKCWISDNAICAESITKNNMFCFYLLKSLNLNEKSEGTGQPLLTQGILNSLKIILPNSVLISRFDRLAQSIFLYSYIKTQDVESMSNLKQTVLSRMASKQLEAVS